jgi:hypothetical protein
MVPLISARLTHKYFESQGSFKYPLKLIDNNKLLNYVRVNYENTVIFKHIQNQKRERR